MRAAVAAGDWITQCDESESGERVWQTLATGKDGGSRWAEAKYPQMRTGACGAPDPATRVHPLVFWSLPAGSLQAWITQCSGAGVQRVYRVDGEVEGHPAAPYLYSEPTEDCR